MSKMSQLHAELSEQVSSLGYQSIEEAEANGYEIDYTRGMLVDGRELAHEEWLKEREGTLDGLNILLCWCETDEIGGKIKEIREIVKDTINFIKKGEI